MNILCYEENWNKLVIMRTKTRVIVILKVFKLFDRMHDMLTGRM